MKRSYSKKHYSLINVLQSLYVAITLLLLGILLIYAFYSLGTVRTQYQNAQEQTMNLYVSDVDDSLRKISSVLMSYHLQNTFTSLTGLTSEDLFFEKQHIQDQLSTSLLFLNYCEGLFYYDYENNEYCYVFSSESQRSQTYFTRQKIPETVMALIDTDSDTTKAGWYISEMEDTFYIFYLQWGSGICIGSWIEAHSLLPDMSDGTFRPESMLYLTDDRGNVLCGTDDFSKIQTHPSQYMSLSASLDTIPLSLSFYAPRYSYLPTMSAGLKSLMIITVIALMTIPAVYALIKRIVRQPLNQVLFSISQYESGHSAYIPSDNGMPHEIIQINHALTNMYQEIQTLKIDIYEKQLNLKEVHLQYLQHQIKPHFVINILNTVSLLAQMNETGKIVHVLTYLSDYMRNMININIRTATLSSEIRQLKNYLKLQEIRYPDQVTIEYKIDPELESFEIPVLTLQTLAENIFKHAMDPDAPLKIWICAVSEKNQVILTVKDNGCGFPEEVLEKFNAHPQDTGDGHHIGLVNIRQRLNLEYPEGASITLRNDRGGVVIICLPR